MGKVTVTIQNLDVVKVDMDKNVLLVKGSVPGPKGTILKIKKQDDVYKEVPIYVNLVMNAYQQASIKIVKIC